MAVLRAPIPRPFIEETVRLVGKALGAEWLAFYSVDARNNLHDFVLAGVPPDFHSCYEREMFAYDPLHARHVGNADAPMARLSDADKYAEAEQVRIYGAFLHRFAATDVLELLFYDGRGLRAGLNVTWTDGQAGPTGERHALAAHLQRYIQYQLRTLFPDDGSAGFAEGFGLTAREREVASLVQSGHTNGTIAARLGVRVSTVKTHLQSIYEKCQVKTRAGLVGRLSDPHRH